MSIDRNSAEWKAIAAWANARVSEMREENDGDLDTKETATIRGSIKFAKELLELGEEPGKKVETEDGEPYPL